MSAPTAAITVTMAMVATETMGVGIMVLEITRCTRRLRLMEWRLRFLEWCKWWSRWLASLISKI